MSGVLGLYEWPFCMGLPGVKKNLLTSSRGHFTPIYNWFLVVHLGIRRTWVDHRSRDSDPGIPIFANLKGWTLTTKRCWSQSCNICKNRQQKTTFLFFLEVLKKNVRNPRCHSCQAKIPSIFSLKLGIQQPETRGINLPTATLHVQDDSEGFVSFVTKKYYTWR